MLLNHATALLKNTAITTEEWTEILGRGSEQ